MNKKALHTSILVAVAGAGLLVFQNFGGTPSAMMTIDTIDHFVAQDNTGLGGALITGYHMAGDGGGGVFALQATDQCAPNGGSILQDKVGNCFYRTTSNYGPREWGACGNGICDDTVAINAWLSNPALPNATNSTDQQRLGFAGIYRVTGPIVCPAGTIIDASSPDNDGGGPNPAFEILGDPSFAPTGSYNALFNMQPYCHITGVGIAFQTPNATYDTVHALGDRDVIDGHSYIANGFNNVSCVGSQNQGPSFGLFIDDSQIVGATNYNVYLKCPNLRLSGDLIEGGGMGGIYFTSADMSVSNSTIENSTGFGIVLDTATLVTLTGDYFNDNGGSNGTAALEISSSVNSSISGCKFNSNGGGQANYSSHVLFAGANANVVMNGNVYSSGASGANGQGPASPNYAYNVSSGATFANMQIYESAAPQIKGAESPPTVTAFTQQNVVIH